MVVLVHEKGVRTITSATGAVVGALILLLTHAAAASEKVTFETVSSDAVSSDAVSLETSSPPTKKVRVSAERFHFVPSRIKVEAGTRLEIELTSEDVEHGFSIVGFEIDVRIPEAGRGSVTVVFDPPAKGRYRFQCSHQCGAGHASMTGVIVVKGGSK